MKKIYKRMIRFLLVSMVFRFGVCIDLQEANAANTNSSTLVKRATTKLFVDGVVLTHQAASFNSAQVSSTGSNTIILQQVNTDTINGDIRVVPATVDYSTLCTIIDKNGIGRSATVLKFCYSASGTQCATLFWANSGFVITSPTFTTKRLQQGSILHQLIHDCCKTGADFKLIS